MYSINIHTTGYKVLLLEKIKYLYQTNPVGEFSDSLTKTVSSKYIIKFPKNTKEEKLPLLVYLHCAGASNCIMDNDLLISKMPKEYSEKCVYLHPLCPENDIFSSDNLYSLIQDIVKKNSFIDKDKIFGVGFSLGARSLWSLAYDYPNLLTAIVPISGYTVYLRASKVEHLPIWCHHSVNDSTVPVEESDKMMRSVYSPKNPKGLHIYSRYKNGGHGTDSIVYKREEVWEWLFQQNKKDIN